MSKNIALFGATGSIGTSVLKLIENSDGMYNVKAITCNNNVKDVFKIAKKFNCRNIGVANVDLNNEVLKYQSFEKVVFGIDNFNEFISDDIDIYILAISGLDSFYLSLNIAETGKVFATANKENIISLGKILLNKCEKFHTKIFPLDSEHNAIYQLLDRNSYSIKDIVLTASGGPFLNLPLNKFNSVTPEMAIKHPKWKMGKKISIDSANLMNKSLEIIEAKNLFGLENNEVNAIIHPQAIIHGLVNFKDNSTFAFLSQPNMEIPISSLFYPKKNFNSNDYKLDLEEINKLEFYKIKNDRFPSFSLCRQIMDLDGIAPHLFNYINDKLVNLFLEKKIIFPDIVNLNEEIIGQFFKIHKNIETPLLEDILESNRWINQNINAIINI